MAKISSGLLMYRLEAGRLFLFLAHPGGPFFKNKDDGNWTIPKGLVEADEDLLKAAIREFEEETGIHPEGEFLPLGSVKYKNGKVLHAWAFSGSWNSSMELKSNTFEIEWPPKSGRMQVFPEIDQADFFEMELAMQKIHPVQAPLINRLKSSLISN